MATISALEAMRLQKADKLALLDVRSEGEFAHGHFAGSYNAPILKDDERHQVGLTYKQVGQDAAVKLGHALVDPQRPVRVAAWADYLKEQSTPLVACWRGGLRSGLAQAWLKEAGVDALRVEGGYKALRAIVLAELSRSRRGALLTGNTGSGKTSFLRALGSPQAIDLEALANHRGSSFGGLFLGAQPSQQTFENKIGQKLFAIHPEAGVLLEDESRLVGRCVIPEPLFSRMAEFPRVELETPLEERVQNLKKEYVSDPLKNNPAPEVEAKLLAALAALKNRLGGADTKELQHGISEAFAGRASHEAWIEALLARYYDPLYAHSAKRRQGPVVFRGSAAAVKDWLRSQRLA